MTRIQGKFVVYARRVIERILCREPEISYITGALPGPYASMSTLNKVVTGEEVHLSQTCEPFHHQQAQIVRARCPPMKCGIRQHMQSDQRFERILRIRTDDSDEEDTARQKRNDMLRIVGGDRSLPHEWPFVVAIFENGRFICGGTIHTADWVGVRLHAQSNRCRHFYGDSSGLALHIFIRAGRLSRQRIVSKARNRITTKFVLACCDGLAMRPKCRP